jgi:tRNA A-37 threonylcarbamoyl transferase component Bud32
LSAVSLAALVCKELRLCWGKGERVRVEAYLARHPRLADDPELLLDLLYTEFLLSEHAGEAPCPAEYLARFPAHAEALRRRLEVHRALQDAGLLPPAPGVLTLDLAGAPPTRDDPVPDTRGPEEQWAGAGAVAVPGYEVLGLLGKGGMGVVYKARHQLLGRVVALKMYVHAGHAGPHERRRFRAEAEAVARLQHPGVVQVFEVGEHNGLPYLSLEYCPGGSLAQKLTGTPWQPGPAAALVEALARAVQAAHAAGIVHRDLKPGNVLLADDGTPKVADFSLAKLLDTQGHTQTGALIGTPRYMAPEQAAGKKDVGPAADIYALGAILYEMLTGRPPFLAATTMDLIRQVVSEEPVSVRRLQPKVPRDLETVCLKCLQKDPRHRYASAAALAVDLHRFQAGEPVQARPVGVAERGWRWCRRNPALAGSLFAGVLSLLAATVVSFLFALRADRARQAEAARAAGEAAAKQEADLARQEAQRQLIDLCSASGLTAAREGDPSLALLWFARAMQLARDNKPQEELNRIRLANWLRQVCLPEGAFAVPGFRHKQDRFRTFRFSPDGKYLLVLASTGDCLVWDRPRGRLVELPQPVARASAAAWQPVGGLLAVAGSDGRIRLLVPPEFRPAGEVVATGEVAALAFSRKGRLLAWGGSEGARVWDVGKKEYVTPLLTHPAPVASLSFSAAGDRLATSARDRKARVFPVTPGGAGPLFPPVAHWLGEYSDYAFSDPGQFAPRFAAGDRVLLTVEKAPQGLYTVVRRSVRTGERLTSCDIPGEGDYLVAFAVSPRGRHAVALWGDSARLFDASSGEVLAALPHGPARFLDATFAADGKSLVTCGGDGSVRFWSVGDRPDYNLNPFTSPAWNPTQAVRVDLSPDGRHAAAALSDGEIRLWHLPEGPPAGYSLPGASATQSALSPDGLFVLPRGVSYRNGTLLHTRVYRADSGRAAGPRLDPGGILLDAAFSPDAPGWRRPARPPAVRPSEPSGCSSREAKGGTYSSGTGRPASCSPARSPCPASRAGWLSTRTAGPWRWCARTIVSFSSTRGPAPLTTTWTPACGPGGGELPTSGGPTARRASARTGGSW